MSNHSGLFAHWWGSTPKGGEVPPAKGLGDLGTDPLPVIGSLPPSDDGGQIFEVVR